jgi:hypothetical protein
MPGENEKCIQNIGWKRPLARDRYRSEDNSQMDFLEIECESVHWIELAQDKAKWQTYVDMVMNLKIL